MSGLVLADSRALPVLSNYVQCVITSPPYFGLRDYGLGVHGIGLESTPTEYVETLVKVFREVWRVLKSDGTLWLNLGDSYVASACGVKTGGVSMSSSLHGVSSAVYRDTLASGHAQSIDKTSFGLKPKNLIGIPWRVAFALQADGWYLRSDIIWHKRNPMPEAVRDRPTRAHEYLFLLTKSERYYYYADTIAEHYETLEHHQRYHAKGDVTVEANKNQSNLAGSNAGLRGGRLRFEVGQGRNKRSVWTLSTQPYKGAHFATFPEKLVEPCLLAGSEHWQHNRPRSVVLDPFCGSGTVGVVAQRHGRFFIGCDHKMEYLELARQRIGL